MPYCSQCGAEHLAAAKFCSACGQQLPVPTMQAVQSPPAVTPVQVPAEVKKKKTHPFVMGCAVVIALFVLLPLIGLVFGLLVTSPESAYEQRVTPSPSQQNSEPVPASDKPSKMAQPKVDLGIVETAENLWLIDGGRRAKSRYLPLLSRIHELYPKYSYERLGDVVVKAKELCASQGHTTSTYSALTFIKGFSSDVTPEIRTANPPSEQMVVFILSGCPMAKD